MRIAGSPSRIIPKKKKRAIVRIRKITRPSETEPINPPRMFGTWCVARIQENPEAAPTSRHTTPVKIAVSTRIFPMSFTVISL